MRRLMTVCIFAAALGCAPVFAPAAWAEDSASKRAAAERLAEAIGLDPVQIVDQAMDTIMMGVMQGVREEVPDIPPRALAVIGEEFSQMARNMTAELGPKAQALSVDLSVKYYTEDEIKAVTVFYESPAGRRMLKAAPQIVQEVSEVMASGGPDEPRCAGVSAVRCAAAERLAQVDPTSQILGTLTPGVDRSKMRDWIITMNARYLSEDDLNAAAAFYEQPAGRKARDIAGPMMNDLTGWLQTELAAVMQREIPAAMERAKARMEAEGLGGN